MDIEKLLQLIPNSVSGDGKTFVAALKNYLTKNGVAIDDKIKDATDDLTQKPNHVTNITLLELHAITDGVRSNNIQVSWDITPVEDYAKTEVWYKTDGGWHKAGEASGTQYVMQGAETGKTYYIRVVAVNIKGNAADFDTAPQASIKIKGSQYIPSPPTQFVLTWDEQGPLWKWLFTDNNYIDFFELRLDQNPGVWNDKRLDSTRETWSRAEPGVRAGTAYLYIRNIFGEYSEPAVHQFNKAQPGKPSAPVITSTIDGVKIKMEPLPQGSTKYRLYIKTVDGEEENEDYFETVNSEYIYFFFSGTITVRYQFIDPLGSGEWSDEVAAAVKAGVDISQVPTIDYDKVTPEIKTAIDIANKQPDINKIIDNSIANINSKITGIDSDIAGINANINDITTDVTKIEDNVASITNKITDIDSVINGLDVVSINSTLAELNKQMQSNTSGIQQNADSIASVVTRVTTVESEVEKQGTAINQTAESVTSLAKRVTTNEGKIDTNMSAIQQTADSITSLVSRVDSTESDVDTLAKAVTNTATAIQQNADSITSIAKRVINTENGMEEHTSSIQQNADSITALVKRVTTAESGIEENTTAINQTADSITALAKRVTTNEGKISTNTSAIEQNATSITALVTRVTTAEGNVDSLAQAVTTTATAVQQNADSITSIAKRVINTENGMEEHTSSIQQNADSIAAVVTRVSTVEGTVTAQGTAINQTAESITAVVTELNKDPDKCNYSAISQLQDNILLSVKKDEVINAINISKEGIVIDGNKIHITGDTVFDNNVIVGGAIVADSIAMEHLKVNSISTAKIQANAITADKIMAGAITADKIEAGAINAKHLAADSVGADAIQAGSIVGDKIAANTITGSKLAAANIDLLGALAITGGNVKLSEEGLRLTGGDGSFTLFDAEGINYIDKSGVAYAQVKKMIIGKAYDGQYIKFAAPWAKPPSVLMCPMSIQVNDANYSASSLFLVCEATDVSNNGFKVNNYLRLSSDSYNVIAIEVTDTPSIYTIEEMKQYWYGHYSYAYTFNAYSDVMVVTIPETARYIELSLQLTINNVFYSVNYDHDDSSFMIYNGNIMVKYPGANNGWTEMDNDNRTITAQLVIGDKVIQETQFALGGKETAVTKNFIMSGAFEFGYTKAIVRIKWAYKLKTGEHGSWNTLYGGRDYIAKAVCKCSLKRTYYKFSASEAKIARGYAMFLVTDGSTNTYSTETTVKVLINYDGVPLSSKPVLVNGASYTTSGDGYIEMKGVGYQKYTFAYGKAPVIDATVEFTDGVITIVNIAPADIVCYIKVKYDDAIVANATVTINGEEKTTDSDGKVEIGGLDKHSGEYTVKYKDDMAIITVNYVEGSITTAELYSLHDGSQTWAWNEIDGKTINFTVPNSAHRIKVEAEVDYAEGDACYENTAVITDISNKAVWGSGYSYTNDMGENEEHKDIAEIVAVTPGRTYSLLFECWATSGATFSWGREIDKLSATVTDT